jgi:hypothetical protein
MEGIPTTRQSQRFPPRWTLILKIGCARESTDRCELFHAQARNSFTMFLERGNRMPALGRAFQERGVRLYSRGPPAIEGIDGKDNQSDPDQTEGDQVSAGEWLVISENTKAERSSGGEILQKSQSR